MCHALLLHYFFRFLEASRRHSIDTDETNAFIFHDRPPLPPVRHLCTCELMPQKNEKPWANVSNAQVLPTYQYLRTMTLPPSIPSLKMTAAKKGRNTLDTGLGR